MELPPLPELPAELPPPTEAILLHDALRVASEVQADLDKAESPGVLLKTLRKHLVLAMLTRDLNSG